MGIIKKFFGDSLANNTPAPQPVVQDEREAVCPNCGAILEKIPGRKTKCIHCSKYIYIRTKPDDHKRILVTENQAEQIDEQWRVLNGTQEDYLKDFAEHEQIKNSLRKKWGAEPSEGDVQWSYLNKKTVEYASHNYWGLYRNTRLQMGDHLKRENKLDRALDFYLEVCYLDLNGPNNNGDLPSELLKEYPPFTPESGAFLAPGVLEYVYEIATKLELSLNEIKKGFLEYNEKNYKNLRLPLNTSEAWTKLQEALKESFENLIS